MSSSLHRTRVPVDDDQSSNTGHLDRDIDDEVVEEDDGEELLNDNMLEDYRAIPELDRYDDADLDEEDYEPMSQEARLAAERALKKRDVEQAKRIGRTPAALETDDESSDMPSKRRRRIKENMEGVDVDGEGMSDGGMLGGDDEDISFLNLDDLKGQPREILTQHHVRLEIKRRFRQFLCEYKEENASQPYYLNCIRSMCENNESSLEISYLHISTGVPILAIWIADAPEAMIELFDEVAMDTVLAIFPNYQNITKEIHCRITQLPICDKIRDLRHIHMNAMIKVEGVVVRRTAVFPQLYEARFNCAKCGCMVGPFIQSSNAEIKPGKCPDCQSTGPFNLNSSSTIYRNYQKIILQESPGSVPAGRVPRQKEVILLNDLIDSVAPGELVEVTGIYKNSYDPLLNIQNNFPVFSTHILANYISKSSDDIDRFKLTEEDKQKILSLSKDKNIAARIFKSIAPSIYGHENIKIGLALAMFGGEAKQFPNKTRTRGDINVLLLGDPGTAKSQFLKYVVKTSHRAVYTTGKGASAVGLTASVHTDPLTREWTLEGGALVLADQGMCLIDEFDKMNDQDRTSIHEAMEQQSISISKAGIVTTLKARCSVIAAANPISGRYNTQETFQNNVELTDAILSRFDVLCVVRDSVDIENDSRLADFVVSSHIQSHPFTQLQHISQQNSEDHQDDSTSTTSSSSASSRSSSSSSSSSSSMDDSEASADMLDQSLLRKYIIYARQHCHPKLLDTDMDKVAKLYADLRRESQQTGGILIAVRHMESMIRMAESSAKMHLRDYVNEDDFNLAIRVMLESFISSQKFSVMRSLRKHFQRYISFKRDSFELLLHELSILVTDAVQFNLLRQPHSRGVQAVAMATGTDLLQQQPVEIPVEDFEAKASKLSIENLEPFYQSRLFQSHNFTLDRNRKMIVKSF